MKPTRTPINLLSPTVSPSKGTERIVTKIGDKNMMHVAVDKSVVFKPVKNSKEVIIKQAERKSCNGRLLLDATLGRERLKYRDNQAIWKKNLAQTT